MHGIGIALRRAGLSLLLVAVGSVTVAAAGCGGGGGRRTTTGGTGTVTTRTIQLPSGFEQPRAIAAQKTGGLLFVSAVDTTSQAAVILKIPKNGGTATVLATGSPLGTANAMTNPVAAVLAPNEATLYVADFSSVWNDGVAGMVFRINTTTGAIAPVFSSVGVAPIDGPTGIAVSSDGKTLYVTGSDPADGLGAVFAVDTTSGAATIVAKGGLLTRPQGVTLSSASSGTLFVVDGGARVKAARVLTVAISGGATTSLTDLNTPEATADAPSGIASKSAKLFAAGLFGNSGAVGAVAESGGTATATVGSPFRTPSGVTADPSAFYVADTDALGNGAIHVTN